MDDYTYSYLFNKRHKVIEEQLFLVNYVTELLDYLTLEQQGSIHDRMIQLFQERKEIEDLLISEETI